mmetsp:Transcript_6766/g.5910  ORF Transcript_6766/g.5910 Transcript_6766/m.5910 type:complete len:91 (+) Transcript_6766:2-274(+)
MDPSKNQNTESAYSENFEKDKGGRRGKLDNTPTGVKVDIKSSTQKPVNQDLKGSEIETTPAEMYNDNGQNTEDLKESRDSQQNERSKSRK